MSAAVVAIDRRRGGSPAPLPPQPRGPLPAFHHDSVDSETGAPLPVYTTINGTIPPLDDPKYHRANLWGVTLKGLPPIDGGASGPAQERALSYLFDRYPKDWQAKYLTAYRERGYRQFWLSPADAMKGPSRQSIAQYCDDVRRVIDAGLLPCHLLRSKDYDGQSPDPREVYPLLDALVKFGGVDKAAHAWEASLFYSPEAYRATVDSDATRYPQIEWCNHFQEGYAHFAQDKAPAADFWEANIRVGSKRLLYQYKTEWSAGMMLARGNDVSVRLIAGGTWGLSQTVTWDAFEVVAIRQFNNMTDSDSPARIVDEDLGDLFGYETLCTVGPLPPSGFGGGARRPDGSVL